MHNCEQVNEVRLGTELRTGNVAPKDLWQPDRAVDEKEGEVVDPDEVAEDVEEDAEKVKFSIEKYEVPSSQRSILKVMKM